MTKNAHIIAPKAAAKGSANGNGNHAKSKTEAPVVHTRTPHKEQTEEQTAHAPVSSAQMQKDFMTQAASC
jgi:hypothetical protein